MKVEEHSTVQRIRLKSVSSVPPTKEALDAGWLKQRALDACAADVGFVEIGRPASPSLARSSFLRKERSVVWALLRRKIRLTGPLKRLVAFGKCFPQ